LIIAAFLSFLLISNDAHAAIAIISLITVDLIIILATQKMTTSLDIILSNLRNWQKDRLSFETDINGITVVEVQKAITDRASAWGKECQEGTALTYYKKTKTLYEIPQAVHQKLVIYTVPTLTYEEYSAKLAEVKNDKKNYNKNGNEQTTIALIFLCDRVEQAVLNNVRADYGYNKNRTALVLPFVYDALMRQYYYSACYEYNLVVKPAKNYLLKTIKKVVFGGKLPLENNDRFDYSNEVSVWQDKTLGELMDDIKAKAYEKKHLAEKLAGQLLNGQCFFCDDELYISHNGKIAEILVFPDEENPQKMLLWEPDYWESPKKTPISEKDKEVIQQIAIDYFKNQDLEAIFDLDD
jgi:hypothetical protein